MFDLNYLIFKLPEKTTGSIVFLKSVIDFMVGLMCFLPIREVIDFTFVSNYAMMRTNNYKNYAVIAKLCCYRNGSGTKLNAKKKGRVSLLTSNWTLFLTVIDHQRLPRASLQVCVCQKSIVDKCEQALRRLGKER